ncbi:putative ribonuclease H protein [Citrus sinensis]|uniref:Ribonuclease H protein n=1 Tax=Citrus sinensis TaxID=2711 RepID=A0ACB8N453_CITSI|nr:putative ribonuclease H protein [Citrus sinensis]
MSCARCGCVVENTLHVLRDCPSAKHVWSSLIPHGINHQFFSLNLRDWMLYNLRNLWKYDGMFDWPCLFGVTVWGLWFWRNQNLHNGVFTSKSNVVMDIKIRTEEIQKVNQSCLVHVAMKIEKYFGWVAPTWPWFKLNTDGAHKSSGLSSAGGLIRNCNGEWTIGFGMNIGVGTITGAELWGLYQGLCLAWDNGIQQLQVEVDSLCVTRLVADDEIRPNGHASLVRGIKELLNRTWQVQVKHVYRESNFAADFLANSALSLPVGLHIFNSLPLGAGFWIRHDSIGVSHPRFVLA